MIGENLLYLMVWMVIILVPVLNSKMLEEVHVSLENILIAWLKIAPYLLIFIIHNSLIAPRLLLRKHRYVWYLIVNLLTITAVFSLVAIYEKYVPYDSCQPFSTMRFPRAVKHSFSMEAWITVSSYTHGGSSTARKRRTTRS